MAAFYMLAKGDPSDAEQANVETPKAKTNGRSRTAPNGAVKPAAAAPPVRDVSHERNDVKPPKAASPSMHIDIQVHISPQASAEQIDAIFASMGRHLYRSVA